MIVDNWS